MSKENKEADINVNPIEFSISLVKSVNDFWLTGLKRFSMKFPQRVRFDFLLFLFVQVENRILLFIRPF